MKRVVKWGIIGLGKIANKFASDLEKLEGAQLYAVASRNLDKATSFAKKYKADKAYAGYEHLMKDKEVEVIYIATPHSLHYKLSLQCIANGKAVLCEKPFAMNLIETEEMIQAAREKQVFLMEALWTMFLPHYQFVKKEVHSGKYGKIRSLRADFGFEAEFDEKKRLFNKSLGGGSLLDIGIYPVFIAIDLLGKPKSIKAEAKFASTGVDLETKINFAYENGVQAHLHSSFKEKTPTIAEIELENATIVLNSRFHEPTSVSIETNVMLIEKQFPVDSIGYKFEANHVQQMLREGKLESNLMPLDKTKELMSILDEIRSKVDLKYE